MLEDTHVHNIMTTVLNVHSINFITSGLTRGHLYRPLRVIITNNLYQRDLQPKHWGRYS